MKKLPLYNQNWELIGMFSVDELDMLSAEIREEIKEGLDEIEKITIHFSKGKINREMVLYKNGWTKNNFIFG